MIPHRFFRLLLLAAVGFFGPGCVVSNPRLVVSYEHDESETSAPRAARTSTDKVSAAASVDLKPAP